MMDKINLSIIITILTIVFSVGGSFAVIKTKTEEVDKIKDKTEDVDKRLVKVETNIDNIDENLKEQKADIKQVLKILMEKNGSN